MRQFKIFTLLFASIISFSALDTQAQPGGGMGGGMMGGGELMNIDPVTMMGLFEIDENDAVKQTKVKDSDTQTAIRKAIGDYIIEYGNVASTNSEAFAELEVIKEELLDMQINGDMASMRPKLKSVIEIGRTIRPAMVAAHKKLNSDIAEILGSDEKALKKWNSFYESLCHEMIFNPNSPERGQGGRGGQGGGPHGGGRPMPH